MYKDRIVEWENIIPNRKILAFIPNYAATINATYRELEFCYKNKCDVAVIALSQMYLEHELVDLFKKNNVEQKESFAENINLAWDNYLISDKLKRKLHNLRELRNIFLHSNDDKDARFLDVTARDCIQTVADYIVHKNNS